MANPRNKPAAGSGAEQAPLIEVTLAKHHTHKRQRLQPGAKLQVTAEQKAWMESQGLIGEPQEEQTNG
jgi:hypothetical protein